MKHTDFRLKYILVGGSGVGKSTMSHVLEKELGLKRCITHTTRPPRPWERDGVDYHFRPFLNPDLFFEHASFGGFDYGTSFEELSKGDFIILEPHGVAYFLEHYPAPLTVIKLERQNIDVDENRKARDKAAGFEGVKADITVTGETIAAMSANLLSVIAPLEARRKASVDAHIAAAEHIRSNHQNRSDQKVLSSNVSER